MNICKVDGQMIFTGDISQVNDNIKTPIPKGWILVEPPGKDGVFKWGGNRWVELEEYPEPPPAPEPAPVVTWYSPDKIVLAIDAMGKAEELEAMLAHTTPRIRLRWQKAILFDSTDKDFLSIVDYFQEAWKLTNEQREQLLKSCETAALPGQ